MWEKKTFFVGLFFFGISSYLLENFIDLLPPTYRT